MLMESLTWCQNTKDAKTKKMQNSTIDVLRFPHHATAMVNAKKTKQSSIHGKFMRLSFKLTQVLRYITLFHELPPLALTSILLLEVSVCFGKMIAIFKFETT